jgi:N-methylhydantoinase A
VLPEPPEFERTATIVANAYLGPVVTRYLNELTPAIEGTGYGGDLLLVHSGGAAWTADSAVRLPVRLVNSGPAAGAVAAGALAAATGHSQAISFDMGGTSTDIAVITDGEVREIAAYDLEFGSPIQFPCVDVHCIGAGGGSLAWLDAAGYPHCGPQSAGADPGPAAYGRGGEQPTVTDANLVLGRLGEGGLAGGAVQIRADLAEAAVQNVVAEPLGLAVEEAAAGIVRIVNSNMVKALRRATVERGLDPREFTLIAFGGAGPLHAVEVAAELEIPRVMVPEAPGVTSAFGTLFMDVEHAFSRSYIARPGEWDFETVTRAFEEMEQDARTRLRNEGFDDGDIDTRWTIDFRYVGQVRARSVPAHKGAFSEAELTQAIADFHDAYEAEYKYAMRDFEVESYILRVKGSGRVAKPELVKATEPVATEMPSPREVRPVHFGDGFVDTPVYERDLLQHGHSFEGPAVIDQVDATTVVPVSARAWVDELRGIVIETGGMR